MGRRRFTVSQSIRLDSSGNTVITNGTVSACAFSPTGENWTVDRITVACSSRIKEALCVTYQRFISANTEVGRTYSGSSGDTNSDDVELADGDYLHIVWTGGDANATATATISGYAEVPERGFRAI